MDNSTQHTFKRFNTHLDESNIIYKLSLISVYLFIIVMPWGDGVLDGLVRLFGVIAFGLSALLLMSTGTHKNYTYYHLFVLILWSWIIFSVIWSPDLKKGLELVPRLFQIMLLPLLFSLVITTRKSLLMAYQCYVLGNIIASSIIIYNYLHGIESQYYGRYTIKNIETDTMSVILALAIPMTAYLTSVLEQKILRILYTLIIPIIIFAIFLTGTRTGSIVAIIGILYWLYTHRKASIFTKVIMAIVIIASISVVSSFVPKTSLDRVFSAGKSIKSGTLNYRTVIWSAALEEWKKTPFLGTGLGGLGYSISKDHVNYNEAHNTHIQILTENGIIGVSIYIFLELSILMLILNARPFPEKVFLLALFLSVVVSQLTLHTHLQKETWFTFTMLVIHSLMLQPKYNRP